MKSENDSNNITKNDIRFFNLAREISKKGENNREYKIGAIAVLNNKVISRGYNRYKTDPLQAKYAKYRTDDERILLYKSKVHAEFDCIKKIIHLDIPWSKVKLYVYRPLKSRECGMARPCASCMQLIHDVGIRHIYYTNNIGTYSHEILMD